MMTTTVAQRETPGDEEVITYLCLLNNCFISFISFKGPGHTSYDAGDTSDVSISALKVTIDQSEALILILDQ